MFRISWRAHWLAILTAFLLVNLNPAYGTEYDAMVVGIVDGDTIDVLLDRQPRRIRLSDIDCPEKRQPFGSVARQYTASRTLGRTVRIKERTTDRYGRAIGEMVLQDGTSLNKLLVSEGLAWQYRKYSRDPSYGQLEATARGLRRGLWRDPTSMSPWTYRRHGKISKAIGTCTTKGICQSNGERAAFLTKFNKGFVSSRTRRSRSPCGAEL